MFCFQDNITFIKVNAELHGEEGRFCDPFILLFPLPYWFRKHTTALQVDFRAFTKSFASIRYVYVLCILMFNFLYTDRNSSHVRRSTFVCESFTRS